MTTEQVDFARLYVYFCNEGDASMNVASEIDALNRIKNAYERDQQTIQALTEALQALKLQVLQSPTGFRWHEYTIEAMDKADAALALAKEVQP